MDLQQFPDTVKQTIDVLADKLSVPAEKLLGYAVRGVMVEGGMNLVIAGIIALIMIVLSLLVYKIMKKESRDSSDEELKIGILLVSGIVFIALLGVFVSYLYNGGIQLLAPEYQLMRQILNVN